MKIKAISAHSFVGDYGQMMDRIILEVASVNSSTSADIKKDIAMLQPADFQCEGCFTDIGASVVSEGVKKVEVNENFITLHMDPFLYRCDFKINFVCGNASLTVKKSDIREKDIAVHHSELFRPVVENNVYYRIHEPDTQEARPLVLFMHGGGGCGNDNMLQLTDTIGAIKLAERWPDMYILAPQAPAGGLSMEEAFKKMQEKGDPFRVIIGADTDNDPSDRGWNREYIGRVCDVIRRLIREGKVDAERVYIIGMSMGGFGTIKTVSSAPELFAAAVPICPSMNGESYPILENFPNVPVYIATSYIDHQIGRHAYILRAIQKLWEKGRKDVRYTIFTPEELEAYGIGVGDLPKKELYEQNHNSWILVMHNEYGILDWMISHRKHEG